jgi:poly(3-hydroxybutyrate) depolymerase
MPQRLRRVRRAILLSSVCVTVSACDGLEQAPVSLQNGDAAVVSSSEVDASALDSRRDPCMKMPRGVGTVAQRQTTVTGRIRNYALSVSKDAKLGDRLPLLFVLHGAGNTDPVAMREWFAVESKLPRALAVYPQALARTRADGPGGNVTRWDLSGNDDLAFFDTMVSELAQAYCVDPGHVFVSGFSSGGNFSQHLACLRQTAVKGMAVVAGPGPFSDTCGGAVPVWMTHDVRDEVLPIADARESRDFWAKANGCTTATWLPVPGRPACSSNPSCPASEPVVYCETSGVGHAVSAYAIDAIGGFFTDLLR